MKKRLRLLALICTITVLFISSVYPAYAESPVTDNPASSIALEDSQNSFLGGVFYNSFNLFTDTKCTSDIAKKIIAAINRRKAILIYPRCYLPIFEYLF
jgi:hypothetical protein